MAQLTPTKLAPIKVVIYDVPTQKDLTQVAPEPEKGFYEISDVSSFEYFESIYEPFITARLTLLDSSGILEDAFGDKCGIRKFCAVEVILADPKADENTRKRSNGKEVKTFDFVGQNCFYIQRIVEQKIKGKKQIYTLELLNKDALLCISKVVSRKWPPGENARNIEWNKIIDDLLTEEMKVTKEKNVRKDKTKNVSVYPALKYSPLKIINDACSDAIPLIQSGGKTVSGESAKEKGSVPTEVKKDFAGYAFFETYDAFNYFSLDGLVNISATGVTIDEYHTFTTSVANSNKSTPNEESQSILSYKFYDQDQTSSSIEDVLSGKTGNRTINYFNLTSRKYERVVSEYQKDKCEVIPFEDGFKLQENIITTKYQVEYFDTCDKAELESSVQNTTITTHNYRGNLEDIRSKTSTVRIPGNLALSAGDKVYLGFLKIQGVGDKENELSDKYSGIYVITELAHRLESVNKLFTDLSVCKLKDK